MQSQEVRKIVKKLFSKDREVRLETLKDISISNIGDFDKALVYFFCSSPSIEEKIICLRAFKQFDFEGVIDCIEEASEDDYFEIRFAAFKRVSKVLSDQDIIRYSYILLKGLLDSNKEIVTYCLDFFKQPTKKDKMNQIIATHYDSNISTSCLEVLFLIYELSLLDQSFVLENCLSHKDPNVSSYARKILPAYIEKFPHLTDLSIRTRIINQDSIFLSDLANKLKANSINEIIDFIVKIRKFDKEKLTDKILSILLLHLKDELNPFIIATIIKTLPFFKGFKGHEQIGQFLFHEDQRVVSNCVESLVELGDENILGFIALKLANLDYSCKEDLRIISASIPLLREKKIDLALQYMRALSLSSDHAIYTYLHHLKTWDNSELIESVLLLLSRDSRPKILKLLCGYLNKYSDLDSFKKFIETINITIDTNKRNILIKCYETLLKKYRLNDLPALVQRDLKPTEALYIDNVSMMDRVWILLASLILFFILWWFGSMFFTKDIAPIKKPSLFLKLGDKASFKTKIINQDPKFLYIEINKESYQVIKEPFEDYSKGNLLEINAEYINNTKFEKIKILKQISK
ncbi:MAG: hypothetical protein COB02_13530 [Candidatus Cloacimonadota bacterium]|nr:MAG: hypothetical protein COB02_13530 [Candidatus Cloacimonadota bacterium]